jgi:hypothetical protein
MKMKLWVRGLEIRAEIPYRTEDQRQQGQSDAAQNQK